MAFMIVYRAPPKEGWSVTALLTSPAWMKEPQRAEVAMAFTKPWIVGTPRRPELAELALGGGADSPQRRSIPVEAVWIDDGKHTFMADELCLVFGEFLLKRCLLAHADSNKYRRARDKWIRLFATQVEGRDSSRSTLDETSLDRVIQSVARHLRGFDHPMPGAMASYIRRALNKERFRIDNRIRSREDSDEEIEEYAADGTKGTRRREPEE